MGLFRRKKLGTAALQSASSAPSAVNSVPHSNFTFVDNSKGAAQAIEELSKTLDETLTELEYQGTPCELLQKCQDELDEAASSYTNSTMDCCPSREIWPCNRTNSDLLSIAWKCAAGSYDPSYPVQLNNYAFRPQNTINASLDGTTKTTVMTIVEPSDPADDPRIKLPLLVVAVKGSGSLVDYMVNFNIAPKSTQGFIDPQIEAHAGLLAAAKALEVEVTKAVDQSFYTRGTEQVLFTGHSSGAAVASLLFMHYRVHGLNDLPIRFSSITFGGPPALRPTHLGQQWGPNPGELWLNIVNEYDLIARADKPYILSLADLLRSMYRRPLLEGSASNARGSQSGTTSSHWDLHKSEYRHYGDMIVLQVSQENPGLSGESVLTNDALSISTWKVSWTDFSQLLFTRVGVHARTFYERNVGMIAKKARLSGVVDFEENSFIQLH